jgi:glycosyltransferase involved in cell wall biosynthesis
VNVKISFLEPHLGVFGGIRRVIELSNHLTMRGHQVTIYHSDGSPCKWMKCVASTRSRQEVLDTEHDVLIFNDPNPIDFALAKKARASLKVYYVLELYDTSLLVGIHPKICMPSTQRTLFVRAFLRSPYLKLVNATWLAEWLASNMNIYARPVVGAVNTDMFHPVPVEKRDDVIQILCSGDPRRRKGTETVLQAFEIARAQEPRLRLDTYFNQGIPQEEMAGKYCSADIFVDAQLQGGWNNPVAEAMACGVPVVCTDIGAVQDFACHGHTALVVPCKEPSSMASAILRLVREQGLAEGIAERAYQHIAQFTWNRSAADLEMILQGELTSDPSTRLAKFAVPRRRQAEISCLLNASKMTELFLKGIRRMRMVW